MFALHFSNMTKLQKLVIFIKSCEGHVISLSSGHVILLILEKGSILPESNLEGIMQIIKVSAVVKGYHHYHVKPKVGAVLSCSPEPGNRVDRSAVAVYDGEVLVGHVPALPIKLNLAVLAALHNGIPVLW